MKPYFSNIPNLEYINTLPDDHTLTDFIEVKNLFKRPVIRSDIMNNLSYFQKYTIIGDERPDNVAYKIYNDETLDWVIMLCNNILNIQTEWPLSSKSFEEYLLQKYGTEAEIHNGIHHHESIEIKDSFGRVVFPGGLNVDENFSFKFYDRGLGAEVIKTDKLSITNYEYELNLEEKKRTIYVLRPQFLSILLEDSELRYKSGSTQYISDTSKRVDNIRLYT